MSVFSNLYKKIPTAIHKHPKYLFLFPWFGLVFWYAMLISMLAYWGGEGRPIWHWLYGYHISPQNYKKNYGSVGLIYISDIGTTKMQGVFIAFSLCQGIVYFLTVYVWYVINYTNKNEYIPSQEMPVTEERQKIGQQKLKAPEVPEREKNLFWSEEEQDDDRVSENSSIDVTVKKTTQELKAANISDDLPQSYVKDDIEDDEISYEKSEMTHTSNKPAVDPQDDDSEEGDLTMLTNAVMKMKERQYKRKSILNDLGKMQTLDEPSQSTIKSLKVFVPHQR